MEQILDDPALAAQLGASGRDRVLAGFTLDHHLRDLMAFFDAVVAERRK